MTPQGTQLAVEEAAQVHHSFQLLFRQLQGCLQNKNKTKASTYVSDENRSLLRQQLRARVVGNQTQIQLERASLLSQAGSAHEFWGAIAWSTTDQCYGCDSSAAESQC